MNSSNINLIIFQGTPVNNTVKDIQALVEFINLEPFVSDTSLFGRFFTRPIKNGEEEAVVKLRTLMKLVSLRREKKNILDLNLPPKQEVIVSIPLSAIEREAYNAIHTAIRDFVSIMNGNPNNNDVLTANSSTILTCILRLRQCCNDISLIPTESLVKLLSVYRGKNGGQVNIISKGSHLRKYY